MDFNKTSRSCFLQFFNSSDLNLYVQNIRKCSFVAGTLSKSIQYFDIWPTKSLIQKSAIYERPLARLHFALHARRGEARRRGEIIWALCKYVAAQFTVWQNIIDNDVVSSHSWPNSFRSSGPDSGGWTQTNINMAYLYFAHRIFVEDNKSPIAQCFHELHRRLWHGTMAPWWGGNITGTWQRSTEDIEQYLVRSVELRSP